MPTKTINDFNPNSNILDGDELAFWNLANSRTDKITYAQFKTDLLDTTSSDTEILFNNAGVLDGDSRLTYNPTTNVLSLQGDFNINGNNIINTGTLTLPTATDTLVGRATTDTLTNKSIDANGTGNVITNIGDAEIEAHTSTKITITDKSQLNSAIVYIDQANTFGAFAQVFPSGQLQLSNLAATFKYIFTGSAILADRAVTLPLLAAPDTFVMEAFGQTLTNKTFDSTSNVWRTSGTTSLTGATTISRATNNLDLDGLLITDALITTNVGLNIGGSIQFNGNNLNNVSDIQFAQTGGTLRTNVTDADTMAFQVHDLTVHQTWMLATNVVTVPTVVLSKPGGGTLTISSSTAITTDALTIVDDGTAAIPALRIGTETDGIYRSGVNELSISLNNLQKYIFGVSTFTINSASLEMSGNNIDLSQGSILDVGLLQVAGSGQVSAGNSEVIAFTSSDTGSVNVVTTQSLNGAYNTIWTGSGGPSYNFTVGSGGMSYIYIDGSEVSIMAWDNVNFDLSFNKPSTGLDAVAELLITRQTTGTLAVGIGASIDIQVEATAGAHTAFKIETTMTDIGSGTEASDVIFQRQVGGSTTAFLSASDADGVRLFENLTIEALNIVTDTTTGMQLWTAAAQKGSFWGLTPVVQPLHIIDADGTLADITTKFNTLLAQMATTGLQAAT